MGMALKDFDVVYFVKNTGKNEELRYSLRSIEENFSYRHVWFYGGCPSGIKPDFYAKEAQIGSTKWEKVRNMIAHACMNEDITESFWLFNDDFFVLRPMGEVAETYYDGTLISKAEEVEARHGGERSEWTNNLRQLRRRLQEAGKPELNYAVHMPMLINREKALEVMDRFEDELMFRALYGNYWELGGQNIADPKLSNERNPELLQTVTTAPVVSTSDISFDGGDIGRWLRDRFPVKSRFEVE